MSMRDNIAGIVADAECSDDRGHGSGVLNSDAVADAILAALDTGDEAVRNILKRIGSTPFPDGFQGTADDAAMMIAELAAKLAEVTAELDQMRLSRNHWATQFKAAEAKLTEVHAERDAALVALSEMRRDRDAKKAEARQWKSDARKVECELTALDTDALIRAAVYRAADVARRDEVYQNHVTVSKIRALADDPEAMAAIKAKAGWA